MRILSLALTAALLTGCPAPDTGDSSKSSGDDADGDGFTSGDDCNDDDPSINPDATESCDGVDNNCDGSTDEGLTSTFYPDADGDTYGAMTGSQDACSAPSGYVSDNTDCDDADGDVHPGATETCNDADDDCDGDTDEGLTTTWYEDGDGDGYGNPGVSQDACSMPSGYTDNDDDCNDDASAIHPGAAEFCDNLDNDCDGDIDDEDSGVTETLKWYEDSDGDGYGDAGSTTFACDMPSGYADNGDDCEDTLAEVNPDGAEMCDGLDNDCDSLVDDADPSVSGAMTWYMDGDLDGYGDSSMSVMLCADPGAGYSMTGGECNDADASINPGAAEICDLLDDDCDGYIDDDDSDVTGQTVWYVDSDGDGGGDSDMSVTSCTQPSGYVANSDDPYEDGAFSAFSASGDLVEATDVAATSSGVFAVGFDSAGDPTVVAVDMSTGATTTIFTGYPLVQPSGLAVSDDGSMLYVSDVGATTGSAAYNGGIFEIPTGGGSATEIGASGMIDMPGDVAWVGGELYSTGLTGAGQACLFHGTATLTCGDPLVDPLALAASPDGTMLYVVDPLAEDGQGAVLAFGIDGSFMDVLVNHLDVVFPGGLAVDGTGMRVFSSSIGDPGLLSIATDASTFEVLDTSALLGLPTGVAVSGEMVYAADADPDSTADLFLFSY